jgi:large repetitive protein
MSVGVKAPDGLWHLRFPSGNVPAPLSITTTTLKLGAVNQSPAYSAAIAATGGVTSYSYGISPGSASPMPPGLSLNAATGAITGTPTASGTFVVTFQVIDALGTLATQVITLTINAALTELWPDPLPPGQQDVFYTFTLTTSGGIPPVTIAQTAGVLPAGLTYNAPVISGTPTAQITLDGLNFAATDSA